MRILHIITGLGTGGAERALYNLLSGGLAERFDCAVLSLRDEGAFGEAIRALGVPVSILGIRRGLPGPGALFQFRHLVRTFQPNVIQGWMYHGNLAASMAARLLSGKPGLAWNVRQSLYDLKAEKSLTQIVIRINRACSEGTDAILYNSQVSREQHETFGFESARGSLIPNGFDLTRLCPDPKTALAVRRELGFGPDALVVGHVARFHPMKDHKGFLRAAVKVARNLPQARFLMAGNEVTVDNPAFRGMVPPELMARFCLLGERRDVPRLMQAIDVYCSASSWGDAFPNVLGEAMAIGKPCVTTDVGDSATVVGETGIVLRPSDSIELARALTAMLKKSPEERRKRGVAARARIATQYSLNAIIERYAHLYEGIVNKTVTGPASPKELRKPSI